MIGKILLLLLLFIIIYPIVKGFLFYRRIRKQMEQAQRQMNEVFGGAFGGTQSPREPEPKKERKARVLNENDEYAEFEIVEGPRREDNTPRDIVHEEQVTDAEYEEI